MRCEELVDNMSFIIKDIGDVALLFKSEEGHRFKMASGSLQTQGTRLFYLDYKDINFKYYRRYRTLMIIANPHKILSKTNITLEDLSEYKKRVSAVVEEVLHNSHMPTTISFKAPENKTELFEIEAPKFYRSDLEDMFEPSVIDEMEAYHNSIPYYDVSITYAQLLNRIEYCVDNKMAEQEKKLYMSLLRKHPSRYKHMKKNSLYPTTLYLQTKKRSNNLVIYDKEQERLDDGDTEGAKKYKGVLRMELQIKKYKFKRNLKQKGIERALDNYWDKDMMEEMYFEFLRPYLYYGDYYRIDIAKKMIKASDYKESYKDKLIEFITQVNAHGISAVNSQYVVEASAYNIPVANRRGRPKIIKKYAPNTIKKYIGMLGDIGLNPITINIDEPFERLPNLLDRAKETAEREYFSKRPI